MQVHSSATATFLALLPGCCSDTRISIMLNSPAACAQIAFSNLRFAFVVFCAKAFLEKYVLLVKLLVCLILKSK